MDKLLATHLVATEMCLMISLLVAQDKALDVQRLLHLQLAILSKGSGLANTSHRASCWCLVWMLVFSWVDFHSKLRVALLCAQLAANSHGVTCGFSFSDRINRLFIVVTRDQPLL